MASDDQNDGRQNGKQDRSSSYRHAFMEWEKRIGDARTQARNWRLACLLSVAVSIMLLICIFIQMSMQKRYVYVAEIRPEENITSIRSASKPYEPTVAQKEAFVGEFVHNIMEIPLDPVVLNRQWRKAQHDVSGKAALQLKKYAMNEQPNRKVGQVTRDVKIVNMNNLGDNSFDVTWQVKTMTMEGKTKSIVLYGGVFTLADSETPKNFQAMLENPLGLRIGYFSFNEKGSSQ